MGSLFFYTCSYISTKQWVPFDLIFLLRQCGDNLGHLKKNGHLKSFDTVDPLLNSYNTDISNFQYNIPFDNLYKGSRYTDREIFMKCGKNRAN